MTIDEAIERLKYWGVDLEVLLGRETGQALRLSIEALKWRKHCQTVAPVKYLLLPGETKSDKEVKNEAR